MDYYSFPKKSERARLTKEERQLLKSHSMIDFQASSYNHDLSLERQYGGREEGEEGDNLLNLIPDSSEKSLYSDLQERDLARLVKKIRVKVKADVLRKGINLGPKLIRYYLAIFDSLISERQNSYVKLAKRLKISPARLELLRDGLLCLPSMKELIKLLKADAFYDS